MSLVVIVQTREGQVVCERIYWDQASVLVQIGLLDARHLPVVGVDSAHKAWTPLFPRTRSSSAQRLTLS